jgi:DNA-binding NarL/FixJ family response regulator
MTRVLLVEDHAVVRQGLRALLEAEASLVIAGETGDGLEAVRLAAALQPDVAIVDLMLPGLNGVEVVRQVVQRSPRTRVIVLSMHANEAYVLAALQAGALAYVVKKSSAAELLNAIASVLAGRRYLSPPLSEAAIDAYVARAQAVPDLYAALTTREREVLQLMAEGLTSPEIAARLVISHRTVEMHRSRVMRKLGLESRTDLVRFAIKRGLLPLED